MKEIVNISFPGLGIDEFSIRKIAFTLFGKLDVRWYGILITLVNNAIIIHINKADITCLISITTTIY